MSMYHPTIAPDGLMLHPTVPSPSSAPAPGALKLLKLPVALRSIPENTSPELNELPVICPDALMLYA